MPLTNVQRNGQTEAKTTLILAPRVVHLEKGLDYFLEELGRNAGTVIGNFGPDGIVGGDAERAQCQQSPSRWFVEDSGG